MHRIDISPLGNIEFGDAEIDGETFVRIGLQDPRVGYVVNLTFALPAFVAFADEAAMQARALLDEKRDAGPERSA
ncbi:MAG TPA: hypothetical protein VJQ77_05935 [Novosphingobium sp.]|nr:hypothetical protein [Novosphingobium sp.]